MVIFEKNYIEMTLSIIEKHEPPDPCFPYC